MKINIKRNETQRYAARNRLLIAMAARYLRGPWESVWANANGRRLNGHLARLTTWPAIKVEAGKQDAALLNEPQNCAATLITTTKVKGVESLASANCESRREYGSMCMVYIAWHIHAVPRRMTTVVLGMARNRLSRTNTHTNIGICVCTT